MHSYYSCMNCFISQKISLFHSRATPLEESCFKKPNNLSTRLESAASAELQVPTTTSLCFDLLCWNELWTWGWMFISKYLKSSICKFGRWYSPAVFKKPKNRHITFKISVNMSNSDSKTLNILKYFVQQKRTHGDFQAQGNSTISEKFCPGNQYKLANQIFPLTNHVAFSE